MVIPSRAFFTLQVKTRARPAGNSGYSSKGKDPHPPPTKLAVATKLPRFLLSPYHTVTIQRSTGTSLSFERHCSLSHRIIRCLLLSNFSNSPKLHFSRKPYGDPPYHTVSIIRYGDSTSSFLRLLPVLQLPWKPYGDTPYPTVTVHLLHPLSSSELKLHLPVVTVSYGDYHRIVRWLCSFFFSNLSKMQFPWKPYGGPPYHTRLRLPKVELGLSNFDSEVLFRSLIAHQIKSITLAHACARESQYLDTDASRISALEASLAMKEEALKASLSAVSKLEHENAILRSAASRQGPYLSLLEKVVRDQRLLIEKEEIFHNLLSTRLSDLIRSKTLLSDDIYAKSLRFCGLLKELFQAVGASCDDLSEDASQESVIEWLRVNVKGLVGVCQYYSYDAVILMI
ncbi:hypothetical protein EJB05_02128, partial [Eragrostis curvula]